MSNIKFLAVITLILLISTLGVAQVDPETRAMWHTRWFCANDAQIQEVVDYMVAHDMNMLLVQVYGDGYALYNSSFVPHSPEAPGFDALASAVSKGHAAGLKVHAYINMINIYSGGLGTPGDPNHIINSHPEWAMVNDADVSEITKVGQSGTMIFYCPEHSGFSQYCRDVAVEIATNYAVDGVHMDYIRYPENNYCYCDLHKNNFYSTYGRYPSAGDADWDQWRFDDITDLVTWIYNDVHNVDPLCEVSAATWKTNGAYFQDAFGMLEAGVLDSAMPMTYTSDDGLFTQWVTAYHENSGGRNVYPGIYVPSNRLKEDVIICRNVGLEGQALFCYADIGNTATRDINVVYTAPADVFPLHWLDGSPDIWDPVLSGIGATGIMGDTAVITWHTDEKSDSKVDYGLTTSYGDTETNSSDVYDHVIQLTNLSPDTLYHYKVTSVDPSNNSSVSTDYTFTTTSGGAADIIIDDDDAGYTSSGNWYYGTGAGDAAYNGDYYYATDDVVESASARYTPYITNGDNYEVYIMYRAGANRCTNVPYTVYYSGGSQTFLINQEINGGPVWNLLGTFFFAEGDGGSVKIANNASGGDVVCADAVKWVASGGPTPTPTPSQTPTPTPTPTPTTTPTSTSSPTPTPTPTSTPGPDIIVDNDDGAPAYTETGTWQTGGSPGYNGLTYRYASAGGDHTATWTANLPDAGSYEVFTIHLASSNRATSAKFDVHASDGTHSVYINQTLSSLYWVSLGFYSFNAGDNTITLDALGSSGGDVVIADAVKFVLQSGPTPTPTATPLPPLAAPSDLQAVAISTTQVDLSWVDNSSDEDNFVIERKKAVETVFGVIDTVPADTTSYNDFGVRKGTTYNYRVKATNIYGDSDYSNVATVTTPKK